MLLADYEHSHIANTAFIVGNGAMGCVPARDNPYFGFPSGRVNGFFVNTPG